MIRFSGLFTIIPAAMLLTVSFFVMFALARADSQGLKKLGKLAAAMLWASAGLVLLVGLYILATGHHPLIVIAREVCEAGPISQ